MKKTVFATILVIILMFLLPIGKVSTARETTPVSAKVEESSERIKDIEKIKVLMNDGSVIETGLEEYIFGVVAAEMPALYEKEALKAQAVAAHSFALSRTASNTSREYSITSSTATDQGFITEEEAREKWGEKADEYIEKIKGAVSETANYIVTYNGKVATTVFHALSSGKTENGADIWGGNTPYLTSVSSEGDKLANNYITENIFSKEELKEKLSEEVTLTGEPAEYFGEAERTSVGTVKKITVCGKQLTGEKLRNLLNLRSANFTVTYKDEKFCFKVLGYGHGVGMSQNGANYMAKQGSDFKEILMHYNKGCKIETIKAD